MNPSKGYFKANYGPLTGKNWITKIPEEERKALTNIAYIASECGRRGGKARASTALRDSYGRFLPNKEIK